MHQLKPIGIVKNRIKNRSEMYTPGVKSLIEIYPEYLSGLKSIEENSHIIVLCFLDLARRNILKVKPKKYNICSHKEMGVFATRSPDRPNPVSFSVVRLISRKENILEVNCIDVIDNTPVIDIKPYMPSIDGIYNFNKVGSLEEYNASEIIRTIRTEY